MEGYKRYYNNRTCDYITFKGTYMQFLFQKIIAHSKFIF